MAYLTQDELTNRVANLLDWAKNLDNKITLTDEEIEKYLRNVKDMTAAQIDHLEAETLEDLVQPACCYCLHLCYLDMAEGNNDAYAALAVQYRKMYFEEMERLVIKFDLNFTETEEDSVRLPATGPVML